MISHLRIAPPISPLGPSRPSDSPPLTEEDAATLPFLEPLLWVLMGATPPGASLKTLDFTAHHADVTQHLAQVDDTPTYAGTGTCHGRPLEETWTFGSGLQVDGHVGTDPEHLEAVYTDDAWHVTGQVGTIPVHETLTPWSRDGADGYSVDRTVGATTIHREYTRTPAGPDGHWSMGIQGSDGPAQAQFLILSDRQGFIATDPDGATTSQGDAVYTLT